MSDVPPEIDYSELFSPEDQPRSGISGNSTSETMLTSAVQKLLQQPKMMFPIVESLWSSLGPKIETSVRKVVKEELQEKFKSRGKWMSSDEAHSSEKRNLALKFSGKVLSPVYTGQVIKGDTGESFRVSLVDGNGNLVKSGAEASSRVKLTVLVDSGSGAKKPRVPLVSPNCLRLNEGTAVLDTVVLKRKKSKWAHSCRIKLVARTMRNDSGVTVKRAETEPFSFGDCRGTRNKKHYPPSLSDAVWRLKEITRNGELHQRLSAENIESVEQILISYNTDPQNLQQKLNIGVKQLKIIMDHAETCQDIPEKQYIYYSHKFAVIFDEVRQVRGLLYEDRGFVHADDLGEDVKADARQMVKSAFQDRENVQPYDNEASTSHFHPQVPNEGSTYISDQSTMLKMIGSTPMWSPWDDYALMDIRGQSPEAILDSTYRENGERLRPAVNLRSESQPSRLAKGRWKMVVMSMKFLSIRKKIVSPGENN